MGDVEPFGVAAPLDRQLFLDITLEVLEKSLLVFCPFGIPKYLRASFNTEDAFIRRFSPRFRQILEAVSEAVYAHQGVSESEMAVTLHRYVEEEKDEEVMAAIAAMGDALRQVYSPPRIVELSTVLSAGELASLSVLMGELGVFYRPGMVLPIHPSGDAGGCSEDGMEATVQGGTCLEVSPAHRQGDSHILAKQRQARVLRMGRCWGPQSLEACNTGALRSNVYPEVFVCLGMQVETPQVAPDDCGDSQEKQSTMSFDMQKAERMAVVSSLSAMDAVRERWKALESGGSLRQPTLQALAEAHASGPDGIPYRGNTCDTSGDDKHRGEMKEGPISSSGGHTCVHRDWSHKEAVEAVDSAACVAFADDPLFALVHELEWHLRECTNGNETHLRAAAQERTQQLLDLHGASVNTRGDQGWRGVERWLEVIRISQVYRALAEESVSKGSLKTGVEWYSKGFAEGYGWLPDRSLSELLASRAVCEHGDGLHDAAARDADAALALFPGCADGYLVRGQCRQMHGNHEGALDDLVKSFVLDGGADPASATARAQAIEDVAREACRTHAG
ncbi:unnamed protein product [Choristocarpus tenellus]